VSNAKKAADVAKKPASIEAAAKATGGTAKTTDDFNRAGAAEGLGPAGYFREAFRAPSAVIGPIQTPSGPVIVKVIAKTPADASQFAAQQEKIIQELKEHQRLRTERPVSGQRDDEAHQRRKGQDPQGSDGSHSGAAEELTAPLSPGMRPGTGQ
jgi:hypothetical protein